MKIAELVKTATVISFSVVPSAYTSNNNTPNIPSNYRIEFDTLPNYCIEPDNNYSSNFNLPTVNFSNSRQSYDILNTKRVESLRKLEKTAQYLFGTMREISEKEQDSIDDYISSISTTESSYNFFD